MPTQTPGMPTTHHRGCPSSAWAGDPAPGEKSEFPLAPGPALRSSPTRLIGTVKPNGLHPQHYLRCVFEQIADHPINHIQDLLTWNLVTPREDRA